jgi:hypothetical protein
MKYYTALKRKEALTYVKIRINLEEIVLSAINQS